MNGIQTWGEAISVSLIGLWDRLAIFFPVFLGAVIVFVFGWIIASIAGSIISKTIKTARIDQALEKVGFNRKLSSVGVGASISELIGGIVKWFLVLVFLMAATNILSLIQVTNFLNEIILYIPNVIVAVLVLAIAFLVGNLVYNIVKGSTRAAGVMSATLLATLSKWAIIIFGILAALIQLGIATSLVSTMFTGFIAAISLAIGLSFGLGGKDEAALILKKLREEITEKHN
jgi:hypothetical protein